MKETQKITPFNQFSYHKWAIRNGPFDLLVQIVRAQNKFPKSKIWAQSKPKVLSARNCAYKKPKLQSLGPKLLYYNRPKFVFVYFKISIKIKRKNSSWFFSFCFSWKIAKYLPFITKKNVISFIFQWFCSNSLMFPLL